MTGRFGRWAVFLIAVLGTGAVQGQDANWQELQQFSAWMQGARSFYAHTQAVSAQIEVAESLIDEHVAGAVSRTDMQAGVAATLGRTDAAIDEISAALQGGLNPPDIDDPHLRQVADTFIAYLQTIDDELRAKHRTARALRDAALAGDWERYDLATAQSLRLTARALRSEGTLLTVMMQMQDPGGPTHALSRTMIALYEPSAIQLELFAASIDGQAVDIGTSYSLVEASVFSAEKAIADGEAAVQSVYRQAAAARNDSSADPAVGEFLSRVAASFERSFQIERRLLVILSEFQVLMLDRLGKSEPLDEATMVQVSSLMMATEQAVAARFAEQSDRLSELQSLAAAMQR